MWFRQLLCVVAAATAALATPLNLQKRATQVSLIGHTYSSNVLSGTINVSSPLNVDVLIGVVLMGG